MFVPTPRVERTPIDIEQALASLGGNMELLTTVVQMVVDQAGVDMAAIRNDVATNSAVALAASSHRLKGSLGAIAAQPAYQACSALNTLARIGAADSYVMGFAHLEEELGQLLPCLQTWLAHNKN